VVINIEARNTAFSPEALTVPAATDFRIRFANADVANTHNVTISTNAGVRLFYGDITVGVKTVTYLVQALSAGTYRIGCVVHPTMAATLTVD
jgi:plastocyanin